MAVHEIYTLSLKGYEFVSYLPIKKCVDLLQNILKIPESWNITGTAFFNPEIMGPINVPGIYIPSVFLGKRNRRRGGTYQLDSLMYSRHPRADSGRALSSLALFIGA